MEGEIRGRLRETVFDERGYLRLRVIGVAALMLYVASGCYSVSADQQAVVLRFGRVVDAHVPAGVHWTWPAPIGQILKLRVRETRRLSVGLNAANPGPDDQFLTGDSNILNVRLVVQFAINDPAAYLFDAEDVNAVVATVAQGALVQAVAERGVDDLLT
ncbi:MAG: SPFH domain-containing protein, partial [Vicinamibacterales bacterium]